MKAKRKIIRIGTIITGIASVLSIIAPFAVITYINYKCNTDMKISTKDAASIGIIGSADGPTSILVSSLKPSVIPIILILLTIIGVIYLTKTKSKKV